MELPKESGWKKTAAIAAGAGAGAALMYLLDPDRGRARRAWIADRTTSAARGAARALDRRMKYCEDRAWGTWSEWKRAFAPAGPVPDEKLAARVHTALGRVASRPGAIHVTAANGRVCLEGVAPLDETALILAAVGVVPGVKNVDSRLQEPPKPPQPREWEPQEEALV